jgi:hypothetical protein
MKAIVAITVALTVASVPAAADTAARTRGIATYTPPDGFTVDDSASDHVMVQRIGTKSYCLIGIFDAVPATGDLDASFAAEWNALVLHDIDPVAVPAPLHRDLPGGAHAAFGMAPSTVGGKPVLAMLAVIDAGSQVVPVFVMTPSLDDFKIYSPSVQALIASISVPVEVVAAQPVATTGIQPPAKPLSLADLAGEWRTDDQAISHYVNASTGAFADFDAIQYAWKLTITAKGAIDTEFRGVQTTRSTAAFTTEKHHAQITVKPDGTIHVHVKAGEGNDWDYLVRGIWVGPDVTIIKVAGPYWSTGIPDDVRKNPSYGVSEYWVRKNAK